MVKKSAPKKAASGAKKTSTKKTVTKSSAAPKTIATVEQPFFEFRITQQTLYWAIFGIVAITFTLWIYSLDAKVRDLYDQLDDSTYTSDIHLTAPAKKASSDE